MKQSIIKKRAMKKLEAVEAIRAECLAGYLNKLAGMTGGEKDMFLREHRDMILEFLDEFGEGETQRVFHFSHDTLERLIRGGRQPFNPNFTKADKAIAKAEIIEEAIRELRGEVKELKEQYAAFQETVGEQLKDKFFLPLLRAVIKLDPEFELKPTLDPLGLSSLLGLPEAKGELDSSVSTPNTQTGIRKGHQKVRSIMERTLNPFTEKT